MDPEILQVLKNPAAHQVVEISADKNESVGIVAVYPQSLMLFHAIRHRFLVLYVDSVAVFVQLPVDVRF